MRRMGPIFWPILLIAVGVIFLLSNLGVLPFDAVATLAAVAPHPRRHRAGRFAGSVLAARPARRRAAFD